MTYLALRFDLRIAPIAKTTFAGQHQAMLEIASWADRVGFATLCLSEHHGDPAGHSSLMLHPLMGGIEPAVAWEGLRLFEKEVLPELLPIGSDDHPGVQTPDARGDR